MSLQFHTIVNDDEYNFFAEIALRNAVLEAGRKNIIFVEGYDDKVIFEILFAENLTQLCFIDVSLEEAKRLTHKEIKAIGGCEQVKWLLSQCVQYLNEKRFYGVIDRDLKTNQEIEAEKTKSCYDGRLFIFFERYTLENYFIESNVLYTFLKGQSITHKKLIPVLKNREQFERKILQPILACLKNIGAANLTIRFFDHEASFLENTISCREIGKRTVYKLKQFPQKCVLFNFILFKNILLEKNETQKFASAKEYFAYQFNRKIKKYTKVDIQLNNHKSELARILKIGGLPKEFRDLLSFVLQNKTT